MRWERLDQTALVYLDKREKEACLGLLDLLGHQESGYLVQRVQSAKWDRLVHRVYPVKGYKDKRVSLDFRAFSAPEVLQDKDCRETRGTEGSEERKA